MEALGAASQTMAAQVSELQPFRAVDHHAVAESVLEIIAGLGLDPYADGLKETPRRVSRMLFEVTQGYLEDPAKILGTVFEEPCDQMVVVKDLPFWSLCEHHMLPFFGTAALGYIPDGRVVGLSKIPRLLHCFARRLQVQERLTTQVAQAFQEVLRPIGVAVVLNAHHTCMGMRGVRSSGNMVTSAMLGCFREEAAARHEFLDFLSR